MESRNRLKQQRKYIEFIPRSKKEEEEFDKAVEEELKSGVIEKIDNKEARFWNKCFLIDK
jgi:hypothetical protein